MTFGFLITSQTREELHAALPILQSATRSVVTTNPEIDYDLHYAKSCIESPTKLAYLQGSGNKRVSLQETEIGDIVMVPFPCWAFEQDHLKEGIESSKPHPFYSNGSLDEIVIDKIIEGIAKAFIMKGSNVFGFGGYTSVVVMPKAMRGLNAFVNLKLQKKLEQFYNAGDDFINYQITEKEKQEGLLEMIADMKGVQPKTYNTSGSYLTAYYSLKGLEEIARRNNLDLENTAIAVYGMGAVSRGITELILEKYESADIHIIRRNHAKLLRDISELKEKYPKARINGSVNENADYKSHSKKIIIVATSMLHPFLKAEDIDEGAIVLDDGRPKSMSLEEVIQLEQKGGQYFTLGLLKSKLDTSGNQLVSHGLGKRIMAVAQLKNNQHLACFAETLVLNQMLRSGVNAAILERYSSLRVNLEYMKDIVEAADEIFEIDV